MSTCLLLVGVGAIAALAFQPPEMSPPVDELQRVTITAGDLICDIGNQADHGAGKTGYIGLHGLAHSAEPENLFVPRYAGIITSRNRASVMRISDAEALLAHFRDGEPWQYIRYRVSAPYYLDLEISTASAGGAMHINSASYMNGPTDRHIYFLDPDGRWQKHFDPEHGNAASVYPAGTPLPVLQRVPNARYKHGTNSFADSVSQWRYDPKYAFYYGRFRDMVYMQMFPPRCGVIFYMSPTGGGRQADGRPNPAWDWRGPLVPSALAEGWATLRMRVVYKKYVSDDDCLDEYIKWTRSEGGSP
ncbi:MAG: hypothetical protein ACE5JM_00360 [Armatimonadota bacterium]